MKMIMKVEDTYVAAEFYGTFIQQFEQSVGEFDVLIRESPE